MVADEADLPAARGIPPGVRHLNADKAHAEILTVSMMPGSGGERM